MFLIFAYLLLIVFEEVNIRAELCSVNIDESELALALNTPRDKAVV
jgi:hypothetical protein